MKIVAVGFMTALTVFAVASAMSEVLLSGDAASSSGATVRRKRSGSETTRLARGSSKSVSGKSSDRDSAASSQAGQREMLDELRQRESEILARQEAMRIVFEEIRDEQQSVDKIRNQVSDELAALREANLQSAKRNTNASRMASSFVSASRQRESRESTRPFVATDDPQAVKDLSVLVIRLARQGSTNSVTTLLRSLKERDATKVLTEVAQTDQKLALRLSQDLLIARDNDLDRR